MSLLQKMTFGCIVGILLAFLDTSIAGETLVETHCAACHSEEGAEGNFRTAHLGNNASKKTLISGSSVLNELRQVKCLQLKKTN